jgi:hypothetical protein
MFAVGWGGVGYSVIFGMTKKCSSYYNELSELETNGAPALRGIHVESGYWGGAGGRGLTRMLRSLSLFARRRAASMMALAAATAAPSMRHQRIRWSGDVRCRCISVDGGNRIGWGQSIHAIRDAGRRR